MLHMYFTTIQQQTFGNVGLGISQFITLFFVLFTGEYKAGKYFGYKLF